MLKEALYPCWGYGWEPYFPQFNKVAYAVVGNQIYFSGLEVKLRTSTINAAEDIIQSICTLERIKDAGAYEWFDLQTHRSYPTEKPGECELNRLSLEPIGWNTVPCSAAIRSLFAELIG